MDEIKETLIDEIQEYSDVNFEGQVFKRGKGGCCFNRRYLIIKEDKLSYYQDQPNSLSFRLKAHPSKAKAEISTLHSEFRIIFPSFITSKSHKNLFQISFTAKSKSKQVKRIIWVFSVINEELLIKWKRAFDLSKNFALEKEKKIQEEIEATNRKIALELKQREEREERQRKAKEEEKIRKQKKDKKRLIREEKRKIAVEAEKIEMQRKAEERKKKDIEEAKKKEFEDILKDSWDYKFQKTWSELLEPGLSFDQMIDLSFDMIRTVGVFIKKANIAVKNLVNQLALPAEQRKIFPVSLDDLDQYEYSNCFIILLTQKSNKNNYWKKLGHELRANSFMFDVLHHYGKTEKPEFMYRVPLITIIDYKGYRGFVIPKMPIEEIRTLEHGAKGDGNFIESKRIHDELSVISGLINLKEHIFEWNSKVSPAYVHLSYFAEIHKTKGYIELEEYIKESFGLEFKKGTSVGNILYFMKLAEILPVEYFPVKDSPDFIKRLRPEFFQSYPEKLSADCFINSYKNSEIDDLEVVNASKYLQNDIIEIMLKDLETLDQIIIDSKSFTCFIHSYGVNIRHLGRILEKTKILYTKNLVQIEMLSRACKEIFFNHISETLSGYNNQDSDSKFRDRTSSISENFLTRRASISYAFSRRSSLLNSDSSNNPGFDPFAEYVDTRCEALLSNCTLDYFNLVFGNDLESSIFWDEILVPLCCEKFSVNSFGLFKHETNLPALLFAVMFHCGVDLQFTNSTQLGQTAKPFEQCKLNSKFKIYQFSSLEINNLLEKSKFFKKNLNHISTLELIDLKLQISKNISVDVNPIGDPMILIELAEVLIDKGEIDKAVIKTKEALVQLHPFSAQSSICWGILMKCFYIKDLLEEAMQAFNQSIASLSFHWGTDHLLQAKLGCLLGDLHVLKKNYSDGLEIYRYCSAICMKSIGPNHVFTCQVNMKIGEVYLSTQKTEEASSYIEKAFLVYQAFYGDSSIITARTATKLADLFVGLGRLEEARVLVNKACKSYQENLENEEFSNNLYEKSKIYSEFYYICLVGLVVGLKINEFSFVKNYAEKLWNMICQKDEPGILLQLIEYVLKAKFNAIGPKKTAKVLFFVETKLGVDERDIDDCKARFTSSRFVNDVGLKGGIVNYINRLVERACFFAEKSLDNVEDRSQILAVVVELRSMMEIKNNV